MVLLDNVILAATLVLIENKKPLTELNSFILDAKYREVLLKQVSDPLVVQFFQFNFQLESQKKPYLDFSPFTRSLYVIDIYTSKRQSLSFPRKIVASLSPLVLSSISHVPKKLGRSSLPSSSPAR